MVERSRGIVRGKVVYYVNGVCFENSPSKRDGREKAERYCLDNELNSSCIQKFDSRTEVERYEYLLEQQNKGLISNLDHHFTLKIQDEFVNANGDTIPPLTYEADFVYKEANGMRVVEDVKGSEYFIDERFLTIKTVFDAQMAQKGLYIRIMLLRNKQWEEWKMGQPKKKTKLIAKQRAIIHAYKQAEHEREMLERASTREKNRYAELRAMLLSGVKMSYAQLKRYKELRDKFGKEE